MAFAASLPLYLFLMSLSKDLVSATSLPPQYDPRLRRFGVAANKTTTLYVTPVPVANSLGGVHSSNHRPATTLYYLPPQRVNAAAPDIAKYRYEGNFYQANTQPPITTPAIERKDNYNPSVAYPQLAVYDHKVLHVEPPPSPIYYALNEYRPRRYTHKQNKTISLPADTPAIEESINGRTDAAQEQQEQHPAKETRYFHDIYMRSAGPQRRDFGHVEQRPESFEQRFESLDKGNRYKGEVKWADASGGYGEHRWNMAQGKL